MRDYLLYFLDQDNHITRPVELECRDDGHAMEVVAEHSEGTAMELWEGARLVKCFDQQSPPTPHRPF